MKNKITMLAIAAALVSFTASVQAVNITGSITFVGGVTIDTGSAGTATAVTGWTGPGGVGNPIVLFSTLSATAPGMSGMPVTFSAPWSFVSGAIPAFWSVNGYTFDLTSSTIFSQGGSPAGVSVKGSGVIKYPGFTDTFGTWAFAINDPSSGSTPGGNPVFSFAAAVGAVPDGGMTVMMLGVALAGLFLVRKQILA